MSLGRENMPDQKCFHSITGKAVLIHIEIESNIVFAMSDTSVLYLWLYLPKSWCLSNYANARLNLSYIPNINIGHM